MKEIVIFSLPLLFSIWLQQAFNSADLIVVGKFDSSHALAAVGSTTTLTNLLIGLFLGISSGASVIAGNFFGGRDLKSLNLTTTTSMVIAIVGGIMLTIIGLLGARPMLTLMQTPPEIIEQSIIYLRICFAGIIFNIVYNFGSAILRAIGDTRRSLYYLTFAGLVNVLLNLLFVIGFHWGVVGVGIATIISQGISAVLVWRAMVNTPEIGVLSLRKLRFDTHIFGMIMKIGIPSGLQSISFNIANIIIQSLINTYGAMALAGNTAALSVEYFLSSFGATAYQAAISFCAQNKGGRQYKRLRKSIMKIGLLACSCTLVASILFIVFGPQILSIYTSNSETIAWGMVRFKTMFTLYVTGASMNTLTGTMRGLGYSLQSFIIVLFFACIFRITWICTIYQMHKTLPMLLCVFPLSWILITLVSIIYLKMIFRKFPNRNMTA